MRVSVKRLVSELGRLSRWVERLDRRKHGGDERVENKLEDLICGCFDLMDYQRTFDSAHWLSRCKRRSILVERPRKAAFTEGGTRSIQDLIDLVISELEACATFRPEVEAGVLPVTASPERSPEHVQAALKASILAATRRREEQEQHSARIAALIA